ncbi:MAG: hypothetical protein K0S19_1277 [Geminicoccaceae bacterium]|nr:hypothetical protein [Geminicoccaceae bacterium]
MAIRATLRQTRVRVLLLLGAGAAAIPLAAAPLPAQTIVLRPIADVSFPTKFSFRSGTLRVSQKLGFRVGARMTLIFSERFDISNAVSYSPGYVTLHGAAEQLDITGGSHSIAGSTAARYWLRPPGGPVSWQIHTGVGMAIAGKPSYLDLFETSTLNAVLGTTVRYQVGQLVSLTVKVQHRLFTLRSGQPAGSGSRPLQMRFGVGFPMLERLM